MIVNSEKTLMFVHLKSREYFLKAAYGEWGGRGDVPLTRKIRSAKREQTTSSLLILIFKNRLEKFLAAPLFHTFSTFHPKLLMVLT